MVFTFFWRSNTGVGTETGIARGNDGFWELSTLNGMDEVLELLMGYPV